MYMGCTNQAMTLDEYMAAKNIDDEAMGKKLKKSRVTVSRYRRGVEPIPTPLVKKLVEMSAGIMTANELIGIREAAE